jgi:hypothetical protein
MEALSAGEFWKTIWFVCVQPLDRELYAACAAALRRIESAVREGV